MKNIMNNHMYVIEFYNCQDNWIYYKNIIIVKIIDYFYFYMRGFTVFYSDQRQRVTMRVIYIVVISIFNCSVTDLQGNPRSTFYKRVWFLKFKGETTPSWIWCEDTFINENLIQFGWQCDPRFPGK